MRTLWTRIRNRLFARRNAREAELRDMRKALRMLAEQHVQLTKEFAAITSRLKFYEEHVPAIKQAKAAHRRAQTDGIIKVTRV